MNKNTEKLYVLLAEGKGGRWVKGVQNKFLRFTDKLDDAMHINACHAVEFVQTFYQGTEASQLMLVEIKKGPTWVVVK